MCGIIGYLGPRPASPILIDGLKQLEYRGYDSAGIAVLSNQKILSAKAKGKISRLAQTLAKQNITGTIGLAHTRWATHGSPSVKNAHPHFDCTGHIAIVHNGIIENMAELKKILIKQGHQFKSDTDSETLAHLIENEIYPERFQLQKKGVIPTYYNNHDFPPLASAPLLARRGVGGEVWGKSPPKRKLHLAANKGDKTFCRLPCKKTASLEQALARALKHIQGAYAVVAISANEPDKIVAAKKGSPLVIGIGENEYLLASDASAIIPHTKQVIYLDDNELVAINKNGYKIKNLINHNGVHKPIRQIEWNIEQAAKSGFDTFMLKEIFEQPLSIANALRGRIIINKARIKFGGLEQIDATLKNISRITIIACGTSWHAALIAEYLFEELTQIPVEVEYASEFRYRHPVIDQNSLVIAISQSGETADTLAALKLAKQKQALTFGICNVVGSSIARLVDAGAYLHAGPEIGVASTKAFTSQLAVLTLLAIHFANIKKTISTAKAKQILRALIQISSQIKQLLKQNHHIKKLAAEFKNSSNFLYLGRGYNFPVALEGALKLKEISYIHAEGYPAAEMKHGPIALIDKKMPVCFIANRDNTYDKIISNIEEVKARGGRIIALATVGDKNIKNLTRDIIYIPKTLDLLTPILNTIPLQLLAYHIARLKHRDVDKPRNLAKSVTVE